MVINNDTEVTGKPVATGKYSEYKFKVGDEVNVKYRGQLYPAIIIKLLPKIWDKKKWHCSAIKLNLYMVHFPEEKTHMKTKESNIDYRK